MLQCIFCKIEKKDQDRCVLQDWRPTFLLNVYTKIASKVIAQSMNRSHNRRYVAPGMKSLLPELLLHFNQAGYM